jgi:hypothetical protein
MLIVWLSLRIAYTSALSVSYLPVTGTPPSLRELSGLAYQASTNTVYMYGGRSDAIYGDMWGFNLATNTWREINYGSIMNPGPRVNPNLAILKDSNKIVLFGGGTDFGLISDLWIYDIESEIVIIMQWQPQATTGNIPSRAYYR